MQYTTTVDVSWHQSLPLEIKYGLMEATSPPIDHHQSCLTNPSLLKLVLDIKPIASPYLLNFDSFT
jgi:hypothetical protein